MDKIRLISHSDKELDEMYGANRRYNIKECFRKNNHYYMQLDNNVLHVNDELINTLHNSVLDNNELERITVEEFEDYIRLQIFNMGIYKFC